MSEKFGLNWQKYGHKRMTYFIHIFAAIKEKEFKESKAAEKANKKSNGRSQVQANIRGQCQ